MVGLRQMEEGGGRDRGSVDDPLLLNSSVKVNGSRLGKKVLACITAGLLVASASTMLLGEGGGRVILGEASWDPRNESWYIQYMVRVPSLYAGHMANGNMMYFITLPPLFLIPANSCGREAR
jgi:hypothetical protein